MGIRDLITAILLLAVVPLQAQTLTLQQAVKMAREQSPLARIAGQQVKEAAARAAQAQAAFMPMVRLSSGYTSSDNAVNVFMFALNQGQFKLAGDLNNPATADNFQASAQVGINLFSGGRDYSNVRAARAAERGMKYSDQATSNEVTLGVTRAYLAILTAREFVRASEAAIAAYSSAEQVMASRVRNGTALKTDLLNIQFEKAQAEQRLLQSRNSLALSKEGLRLAIGLDSLPFADFQTLDQVAIADPSAVAAGTRPEVAARSAFAEAAKAEYRAAFAGYLPSVSAFASADYYKGREFDGSNNSWTAGVTLSWSIFDGLITANSVKEKGARMKAAEEGARLAELQTSAELKSAANSLQESTERVAVMQRAVGLATEGAMLTRQRFDQGLVLSSHVIDAENNLVQAEVGLAQAKADRLYAAAALRRALNLSILGESSQ
jgi:outer membrane protein TolC